VEGETEVLPEVWVVPMPGHTWGQQGIVFLDERGGKVCYVPDVMPTRHHGRPTTNLSYDVESYTSMIERQRLLERACDEDWLLVLDHEHGNPYFRVRPDAEHPESYVLEESSP
jgi:glyoxylase-like metal-dependent hydrolase (beta-lactamase superfamily II)